MRLGLQVPTAMLGRATPQHVPNDSKNAMPICNALRSTAPHGEEWGAIMYGIMRMSSRTSFDPPRVSPQLAQYLGIDVAPADHCDVDLCVGQLAGVEKKRGWSHGAARLSHGLR